jgi:hypothetical protein
MKYGYAIKIGREWFACIEQRETGEFYRVRCRDEAHALAVINRETL